MTLAERLRALADALPSDASSVTLTRADLLALAGDDATAIERPVRDLTVEDVAAEVGRSPSTVRSWLIAGDLDGYKLNNRDWRIPRASLRAYLEGQQSAPAPHDSGDVDIGAWRKVRRRA